MRINTVSGYVEVEKGFDRLGESAGDVASEDLIIQRGSLQVALHLGEPNVLRVNGAPVPVEPLKAFVDLTGYTPVQVHRWTERLRCSCGTRSRDERVSLFGETLITCPRCGRVLASSLEACFF
jgi:hypothetical protein